MNGMRGASLHHKLVVQTEDRIGLLGEITRLLSDVGLSLVALTVRVQDGVATLHLLTDAQFYARDALQGAGFLVDEREVILIELPDHPGFLCRVTEALARKEIAIEELYSTVFAGSSKGLVVFTTTHNGKAVQMLRKH